MGVGTTDHPLESNASAFGSHLAILCSRSERWYISGLTAGSVKEGRAAVPKMLLERSKWRATYSEI